MVHGDETFFFSLNLEVNNLIKSSTFIFPLFAYISSHPINDHHLPMQITPKSSLRNTLWVFQARNRS